MDTKIDLLWEKHKSFIDNIDKIVDKESIILTLKEMEEQKKHELFTEWKLHDDLQNHIRSLINIEQHKFQNLKVQLVFKEKLVQNKIIEHQKILVVLREHELYAERSKLNELLFKTSQNILDNKYDIDVETSIQDQQNICKNFQKLYERAVFNLSKNERIM